MLIMARPRNKNNKGLPPNLYERVNGHYRYRRPDTGKWHSMGKDHVKAISAAKQLNSMLSPGHDLVEKIINQSTVFNLFLDKFETKLLPERDLTAVTLKFYQQMLVHIRNQLGKKLIDDLSVKEIAEFLDNFTNKRANKYRRFLALIFKYAIAHGLCKENPALQTMAHKIKKKRKRLTLETYFSIYSHPSSEPWFRNAMDLGLHTLQRREDLVNLKFSDIKGGYLYVIQSKTKKHGESANLKIKITPILESIISRCRDLIVSPYIIHRRPNRCSKQNYKADSKQHFSQITPDYLTKTFSSIRDQLPEFESIPTEERPSFHEIRSLGITQYEKIGFNAQRLAGHKTRAMTDKYKEGHEPKWTEVEAGLDLNLSSAQKQV